MYFTSPGTYMTVHAVLRIPLLEVTGSDLALLGFAAMAIALPVLLQGQIGGGFHGRRRRLLSLVAVSILLFAPVFGPLFASVMLLTTDTRARWFGGLVVFSVVVSTGMIFAPLPASLVLAGLSVATIAGACLSAQAQARSG